MRLQRLELYKVERIPVVYLIVHRYKIVVVVQTCHCLLEDGHHNQVSISYINNILMKIHKHKEGQVPTLNLV